jgi:hypothetical protein
MMWVLAPYDCRARQKLKRLTGLPHKFRHAPAPLLVHLPVIENGPEQIQLKPAIPPVHVTPVRIAGLIDLGQPEIIPYTDPQPNRALIA